MRKGPKGMMLTIAVIFLMLQLALLVPVGAQKVPHVEVDISDDGKVADLSLGKGVVIRYTGNVTLEGGTANGVVLEATVVDEDWDVTINPSGYIPVTGDSEIEFDGTVAVPYGAKEDVYDLKVSATIDTPGVYPPAVHHDTMDIRVIRNRIAIEVQEPSTVTIVQSNATYEHVFSIKVTNRGTSKDTLIFEMGEEVDRLRDRGWLLELAGEEKDLEAGDWIYMNINVTVPAGAEPGTYPFNVTVLSTKTESQATTTAYIEVEPKNVPVAQPEDDVVGLFGLDYMTWFMISITVLGIFMMFFLGGTEIGLFALMIHVLVPLYCRIKKEKVLDNFKRGEIFGYIKANPGTHYMEIQNKLDVSNGVLAHHLKVLSSKGFVKAHRDGLYKRFYPKHVKISRKGKHLSRIQKDLIEEIERHPGLTQKRVAKYMGESKQVVNYHVKVLSRAGLIRVEKEGGRTGLFSERSHGKRVKPLEEEEEEVETPLVVEAEAVGSDPGKRID